MSFWKGIKIWDTLTSTYKGLQFNAEAPQICAQDYLDCMAEGDISGHASWNKIGFRSTSTSAAEVTMAPFLSATDYLFPTAAQAMHVKSADPRDLGAAAIVSFADPGGGVNTTVEVTSHGLINTTPITISGCGTAGYNGNWVVANSAANTFTIAHAYVDNPAVKGTVAASGIRTLTIYYLDGSYAEKSEVVTMKGTTAVTTAASDIFRIQNVRATTVGSTYKSVGAISVTNTAETVTYGYISAGRTRQRACWWTVPLGKTLYVTQIAFTASNMGSTKYARFITKATMDDKSGLALGPEFFMPFNEVGLINDTFVRELHPPTKLIATVDLKVTCETNDTGSYLTCALRGWTE
jgi:hypothetical protein